MYNELLLACARKRRMEDATFLLHSADERGLELSLHHVQVFILVGRSFGTG